MFFPIFGMEKYKKIPPPKKKLKWRPWYRGSSFLKNFSRVIIYLEDGELLRNTGTGNVS